MERTRKIAPPGNPDEHSLSASNPKPGTPPLLPMQREEWPPAQNLQFPAVTGWRIASAMQSASNQTARRTASPTDFPTGKEEPSFIISIVRHTLGATFARANFAPFSRAMRRRRMR